MAWVLLVAAGLLEIVWATALKHANGLTRPGPSVLACSTALLSFVLLSFALRELPVGTAYAVWVGVGAVGVTIAGIVAFGEHLDPWRLGCILLIAAGIAGLKVLEP